MMSVHQFWFTLIMDLIPHYLLLAKYKQMNPAPSGLRDVILLNADQYITDYKSVLIKGEKVYFASHYQESVISTVCDQEAADLYNDFVTLSSGKQFYQFVNHMIKGTEYIKYIVQ